jgi:plasmid stabilization system protein ParE
VSRTDYTVRLLSLAEADLAAIATYIAADNPAAAEKFADTVEEKLLPLEKHPRIGKIPADPELAQLGYRYLVVENYLVFYVIEGKTVWVHRIIHGARDYKNLL